MSNDADTNDAAWKTMMFVRIRPTWAYIGGISEFGRFLCETAFGARLLAERFRVVLQEALENAVKYSSTDVESELEVSMQTDGRSIEISVSSLPDQQHVATLRSELARMRDKPPERAYRDAIERASNEPNASTRMGLARIRHEGEVELSLHEQQGGRIRVTATGKL